MSVCLIKLVSFSAITDSESCMRYISLNPGSAKASEKGLVVCAKGCVACRLDLVAATERLWVSWCVLCAAEYRACFR